jgi:hypothetical protein
MERNSLLFGSLIFNRVPQLQLILILSISLSDNLKIRPAHIHFLYAQRQAINQFFDQPLASF